MSDTTNADILELLKNQLASVQKPNAWGRTPSPTVQSVSVPIKVGTPAGEIRVYLHFSDISTPEAIMELIESLDDQGYPLDVWKPRVGSSYRDSNSGSGSKWPRSGGGGWRR